MIKQTLQYMTYVFLALTAIVVATSFMVPVSDRLIYAMIQSSFGSVCLMMLAKLGEEFRDSLN